MSPFSDKIVVLYQSKGILHMKYKELNINEKLFGKNYIIYDWVESDKETHIYLKSKSHQAICPNCGKTSNFFGSIIFLVGLTLPRYRLL